MATTAAVSSGVSGRGSAWCAATSANSSAGTTSAAGVRVRPGATAITAMPLLPSPTASVRARRPPVGIRDDQDHAAEAAIAHPGHECLREQQCRLYVHRLHLAPRGER